MRILDAARMAPSSGNQQPWKFLVIQDPERIARVRRLGMAELMERAREHPNTILEALDEFRVKTETYHDGIFAAPILIAVLGDKEAKYPGYLVHDGPLTAANLMLASRRSVTEPSTAPTSSRRGLNATPWGSLTDTSSPAQSCSACPRSG